MKPAVKKLFIGLCAGIAAGLLVWLGFFLAQRSALLGEHDLLLSVFFPGQPGLPVAGGTLAAVALFSGVAAGATLIFLRLSAGMLLVWLAACLLGGWNWLAAILALPFLPWTAPLLVFSLTWLLIFAVQPLLVQMERRQIQQRFAGCLSPAVIATLQKHPQRLVLSGEKREATALHCELGSYELLATQCSPAELQSLIREFFDRMTAIVFENRGTLVSYLGGELRAVFGAPLADEQHALAACRAALQMVAAGAELARGKRQSDGKSGDFSLHIGISSGEMAVGNMGSRYRFHYSAAGASVALASRLLDANKLYGTHILINEDTRRLGRDQLVLRQLDLLRVKGRREPVQIYQLVALKEQQMDLMTREVLSYFEQGYQFYLAQNWERAMNLFRQALQINRFDEPSRLYLLRCQAFQLNPPPRQWNGVYTMRTPSAAR